MSIQPVNEDKGRFTTALGEAVVDVWGVLPRNVQELLFEKAILCGHHDERDESLREQLAAFLHDRHPRLPRTAKPPISQVKYAATNAKKNSALRGIIATRANLHPLLH